MDLEWIDFSGKEALVGFSSLTISYFYYFKIGSLIVCNFGYDGTSNASTLSLTLPFPCVSGNDSMCGRVTDNSIAITGLSGRISTGNNSSTLNLYKDSNATAWTGSGNKVFYAQFFYFTN